MTVPGFNAAQARYDGAEPPEPCCEDEDCACAEDADDARDAALIARDDADRGR